MQYRIFSLLLALALQIHAMEVSKEYNKKRVREYQTEEDDQEFCSTNKKIKSSLQFYKEKLLLAWQLKDIQACTQWFDKIFEVEQTTPSYEEDMNSIDNALKIAKKHANYCFTNLIRPILMHHLNMACLQNKPYLVIKILSWMPSEGNETINHKDLVARTMQFILDNDLAEVFHALYDNILHRKRLLLDLVLYLPKYPEKILKIICEIDPSSPTKQKTKKSFRKTISKNKQSFLEILCQLGSVEALELILTKEPELILHHGTWLLELICISKSLTAQEQSEKLKKISYLLDNFPDCFNYLEIFSSYAERNIHVGLELLEPFLPEICPPQATKLLGDACMYHASDDFFRILIAHTKKFNIDAEQATDMLQDVIIARLSIEAFELLISYGADVHAPFADSDDNASTIVHKIASNTISTERYVSCITQRCVELGINLDSENVHSDTALMVALSSCNLPCIKRLFSLGNQFITNSRGDNVFHALISPNYQYRKREASTDFAQFGIDCLNVWKYLLATLTTEAIITLLSSSNNAGKTPLQKSEYRLSGEILTDLLSSDPMDDVDMTAKKKAVLLHLLDLGTNNLIHTVSLSQLDYAITQSINTQNHTLYEKLLANLCEVSSPANNYSAWMRLRHNLPIENLTEKEIENIVKILYRFLLVVAQKVTLENNTQSFQKDTQFLLQAADSISTTKQLEDYFKDCKQHILQLREHATPATLKSLLPNYFRLSRQPKEYLFELTHSAFSLFFTYSEMFNVTEKKLSQMSFDEYETFFKCVAKEYDITQIRNSDGNTLLHHALLLGNVPLSLFLIRSFPILLETKNLQNATPIQLIAKNAHACQQLVSIAQYEHLNAKAIKIANEIIAQKNTAQWIESCFDQTIP